MAETTSEAVEIEAVGAKAGTGAGRTSGARKGNNKLSRAANQVLVKKGQEIALSLAEHAAKGNVQSVRLLMELAEEAKPEGKVGPSLAEQWGSEAEWAEELAEPVVD